jgi:2-polyprenyl-3-methyl-5-hydroxy-6-metoxy-1,4-benzoquinol methylase
MKDEAATRIAGLYESRSLRSYIGWKIANDPVYAASLSRLKTATLPLLDIGCGVGLLAFYLREHGAAFPVLGVDHDARKIEVAQRAAARGYEGLTFNVADARTAVDFSGNVTLNDVLHYLEDPDQDALLASAIRATAPDGMVIIRDCPKDDSWRYKATWLEESFAVSIRWLKAGRLNFPTRDRIAAPFRAAGFTEEITPLSGKLPFNNHLFVFRRAG